MTDRLPGREDDARRAPLRCAECGREALDDAAGWKAELGVDMAAEDEVVLFYPSCWEREFGKHGDAA